MFRSLPDRSDQPFWIDMVSATPDEIRTVEAKTGRRIPDRAALSEIEFSSRAFIEDDVVYLSMPLISAAEDDIPVLRPVGFVVAPAVIVTVRFGPSAAFEAVWGVALGSTVSLAPWLVFVQVIEALVDRASDRLEAAGADLDEASRRIFGGGGTKRAKKGADARLKEELREIGRSGDRLSKVRDTLLGLNRICGFVAETPRPGVSADLAQRLAAVRADIASLDSYEEHLSSKVQFLLDATLGFINIEQNDVVKILTVVSVVGVPPVLIAGIYGMNFKAMPEYDWRFGYPYALVLMVVSAIVPYLWFKWRKWL